MPRKRKKGEEERIAELEVALEEAGEKAESYLNQLKYAKADLENLQKQTRKRITEVMSRANGELLERLLPIVDELGLASNQIGNSDKVVDGVKMIHGKLVRLLESEGVKPIEALGQPFDPFRHQAVLEVETSDHPDGSVIEEIRRGYTYKDRVLRASMQYLARNPSPVDVKEEKCIE
jgi:molecular chaperone GrpE